MKMTMTIKPLIIPDTDKYNDPEVVAEINGDVAALRSALNKLTPLSQQAITLHFIDGLDYREMAARMGKREATVRIIIHRGLKKLKDLMRIPHSEL